MNLHKTLEITIEVFLFLATSYFIFYKSLLSALGRELAKLSTIQELTKLKEEVKKEFNESIESYKSKLSEELSLKIEPLKSDLAKNNITHQIQFGFLHQERAKVILEMYKKLQELHSAMTSYTSLIQPIINYADKEEDERIHRVNTAMHDFRIYYTNNRLFFSERFCQYIDDVFQEYWDKGWDFGYRQNRLREGVLPKEILKDYSDSMQKISKEIKENFPAKIKEIEDKFRQLLKVTDDI